MIAHRDVVLKCSDEHPTPGNHDPHGGKEGCPRTHQLNIACRGSPCKDCQATGK